MALTNVSFIGSGVDDDRGYMGTICETHNYREVAQFAYQLENFECMACVAITDRERREHERWIEGLAVRGHPSICLCSACAPWEAEYDRLQEQEAARLFICEIESPNYCDHSAGSSGFCTMTACRHAACKQEPPF